MPNSEARRNGTVVKFPQGMSLLVLGLSTNTVSFGAKSVFFGLKKPENNEKSSPLFSYSSSTAMTRLKKSKQEPKSELCFDKGLTSTKKGKIYGGIKC